MRYRTVGIAALLVGGAALAGMFLPRAKPVEVVEVARGPIQQSVVATGRTATPARIELGAAATTVVSKVLVREGDRVRAGQTLIQLRDDEAIAAVRQAEATLAEARARVRQIEVVARPVGEQSLAASRSNLALAQSDFQRTKDLVAKGFLSQAKLDEVARNLDNARSQLATAEAQARANERPGAEYQLALARVAQSEAALKAAQARLANLAITAPVDAVVLARTVESGDIAQAGKAVMILGQSGETRVYANVDEKNLRFLRIGFAGKAIADAFPGDPFAVELYYIAPAVDPQRGTVEIRLRVPEPPAFIRPDMTVSVAMITGRKEDALVVPAEAIRAADTAAPYALAVRDGRAARVPIALGLRGVGAVEIASGVAAGDLLVVAPADVAADDPVRPRPRAPKAAPAGAAAARLP